MTQVTRWTRERCPAVPFQPATPLYRPLRATCYLGRASAVRFSVIRPLLAATAALLAFLPATLAAQEPARGVIAGRVTVAADSGTDTPLAGARISVAGTTLGATSASDGRYRIGGVPAGKTTLRVRLLRYRTVDLAVVVNGGDTTRADAVMHREAQLLSTVETRARVADAELFSTRPNIGVTTLGTETMNAIPMVGEPDVARTVQLLPGVIARGGRLFRRDDESRSESYSDILVRAGLAAVEGLGNGAADPAAQSSYAMHAHGAVFAEVKVDPELGQIRATRLVGAFAAGRVINPRLVRSQYYGGMIWGVSFALHEQAVMDPRSGRPMNPNLVDYHVPVNADVPSLEAILVEENDSQVNALGIKGVGEIGITGTAGAVVNAVWHATGIRVRQFPITLDRLVEPAP